MPSPHIGTLREGPLHSSLKEWYARPGDSFEVPVDDYVIDLVRDDLLIEIQTRGFASMKTKVVRLLDQGRRIRIVHPIAVDRVIVKVDDTGEILDRRRSPRHGSPLDICGELVSFPELMAHGGLEFEVVLTNEEELRRHEPGRAWRRRGWVVEERHLLEVVGSELLTGPEDLLAMLPSDVPDQFTTGDLVERLGCRRRTAQQLAYCLRKTGQIHPVGKRGRSVEYALG